MMPALFMIPHVLFMLLFVPHYIVHLWELPLMMMEKKVILSHTTALRIQTVIDCRHMQVILVMK